MRQTGVRLSHTILSEFGVPHASLLEESYEVALPKGDYMAESSLKEPMDISLKASVEVYQPPAPVLVPSGQAGWSEMEGTPLDVPSWRPLQRGASVHAGVRALFQTSQHVIAGDGRAGARPSEIEVPT